VLCRNIGCAPASASPAPVAFASASAATAPTVNRREPACASEMGAPCGFAARAVPGARLEVRENGAATRVSTKRGQSTRDGGESPYP
jgi:hypothetical protein